MRTSFQGIKSNVIEKLNSLRLLSQFSVVKTTQIFFIYKVIKARWSEKLFLGTTS